MKAVVCYTVVHKFFLHCTCDPVLGHCLDSNEKLGEEGQQKK